MSKVVIRTEIVDGFFARAYDAARKADQAQVFDGKVTLSLCRFWTFPAPRGVPGGSACATASVARRKSGEFRPVSIPFCSLFSINKGEQRRFGTRRKRLKSTGYTCDENGGLTGGLVHRNGTNHNLPFQCACNARVTPQVTSAMPATRATQ